MWRDFPTLRVPLASFGGTGFSSLRFGQAYSHCIDSFITHILLNAEVEGFEPPVRLLTDCGFRDRPIRPLWHTSLQ